MSQEDLARIEEQKRLLREQLAALEKQENEVRVKDAEEKREAMRRIPVVVEARSVAGATITVVCETYRDDVINEFRKTPNRAYRGGKENLIPIKEWESLTKRLEALPNVTVTATQIAGAKIQRLLNAPAWMIELGANGVTLTPGPYISHWIVKDNFTWKQVGGSNEEPTFQVPFSEAWRIPSVLVESRYNKETHTHETVPIEGVVYAESAEKFIRAQLESRAKLDLIATSEDAPEIQEALDKIVGWKKEPLHPFQRVGVKFMLEAGSMILGDDMGLGKTVQYLARWSIRKQRGELKNKTLVVCPASLKSNWARKIQEWTGESSIQLSGGDPTAWVAQLMFSKAPFVIMNYDTIAKRIDNEVVVQNDFGGWEKKVETTWPVVDVLKMIQFDEVVFDEIHHIRNTSSNRSQAIRKYANEGKMGYRTGLSGTPVVNRTADWQPQLATIAPAQFGSAEKFIGRYCPDGRNPTHIDELHEVVKPYFLRRQKKDVFKQLPPINRIVRYHDLSAKAKKIYDKAMSGVYESLEVYSAEGQGGVEMHMMNMLAKITRLIQICAADTVDSTVETAEELYDSSGKKVLIYTRFKGTAYKIAQKLGSEAICFVSKKKREGKKVEFVTAEADERYELVRQFQTDPNVHYIVSTAVGGEGLDITEAGNIIFNDLFWTPGAHRQAEERAYGRINDLHGADSYYWVCENTFLERMMEILSEKMRIIDATVDQIEAARVSNESVAREIINHIKDQMWVRRGK